MTYLIGLTGYKGSGKTTAANYLVAHGFVRISFAEPLKQMLITMGLTEEHIYGDKKETPLEILGGKTPRWAMQTLGTEWGRQLICDDLWVRVAEASVCKALTGTPRYSAVIDDCRFLNEAAMIRNHKGTIIRITRSGYAASQHASETEMDSIQNDFTIFNDGEKESLFKRLDEIMTEVENA